eukprot:Gregarina_sp_Poly_1__9760@NODE_621_length_7097_cov_120_552347_g476_i0_p1_GENE_NODE_621_length_7097_cov_120_552347_g476_i0NODE_621_length_7097_cov_120_552347_g476_i0_p1_ORF_typecomplete_len500_score77_24_NODE_621_length_7097_cov_120_552347_g476_i048466345
MRCDFFSAKNMLLSHPGLRASAAEFVAGVCQSLSCPESVDVRRLKSCVHEETKVLEAVKPHHMSMPDCSLMIDRILCGFHIAGACLEWEIEDLVNETRRLVSTAVSVLLSIDEESVLTIARIAKDSTEESERYASQEKIGDFKDFGSLLIFLDSCLSAIELGVSLLEDESIKTHITASSLDGWLRKHFLEGLHHSYTSLGVIDTLNPTAKHAVLRHLGAMLATVGGVAESEIMRILQQKQAEEKEMTFGARKSRIVKGIEDCNKLSHTLDILFRAQEDETLCETWESALGLGFEYWYASYQSCITEGLVEQYQQTLKYLPQETEDCFHPVLPPSLQSFASVAVPRLLITHPIEAKNARKSLIEFGRWILLSLSLLGQICPIFFPEELKVRALESFAQILQIALADGDEFGFRHYGIGIIAEAMFGLLDNLAEDGFHHLYNAMQIENLIDRTVLKFDQQREALNVRASKHHEHDAMARLEDAVVNFAAFREYKKSLNVRV